MEKLAEELHDRISIEAWKIQSTEQLTFKPDKNERLVVILSGKCNVKISEYGIDWSALGRRSSVFDGPATSFYVSKETSFDVIATSDDVEICVVSTVGTHSRKPYIIPPEDVHIETRGKNQWIRNVYNILDEHKEADGLLVGETFSHEGVWSGYPPHKHDANIDNEESEHEEVFLFKVEPSTGFGIFTNYSDSSSNITCTAVKDMETLYINEGYHTVVSSAGHQFYYLWALVGDVRKLICKSDDNYFWLR